jgi:hypothetical protein
MACPAAARILLSAVLKAPWEPSRLAAGRGPERDVLDAVDAGVAEVGGGIEAGEQVFQPGGGERVASWRAPCTGAGPIAAMRPSRVAASGSRPWLFPG